MMPSNRATRFIRQDAPPLRRRTDPPKPRPSPWEEYHNAGMTAAEAAAKLQRTTRAAHIWARNNGKVWASTPRPHTEAANGTSWADQHAAGATAKQAASAMGMSERSARLWAGRNGVRWAKPVRTPRPPAPPKPAPIPSASDRWRVVIRTAEYRRVQHVIKAPDETSAVTKGLRAYPGGSVIDVCEATA